MNEDPNLADEDRGLYPKYRAVRITQDLTAGEGIIKVAGFPMQEVFEPFFLLKFDDPFAAEALRAYARACALKYPKLSEDIINKLRERRKI